MTYEETIKRLKEMESRYNDGFSTIDRAYLDSLYFDLFGKSITNKGCSDCYRDAYMEICIKLKNEKDMPKKSEFVLKAGAIIAFFGESQCYSNANITDEAALRFLSLNPRNESLFESFPADWKDRIDTPATDVLSEDCKDAIIARLTEENEQLRNENEALKASSSAKKTKKKTKSTSEGSVATDPIPEKAEEEVVETESNADCANDEKSVETDEVSIEDSEDILPTEE